MFEAMWDSVKSMFVREDGSVKWLNLVAIAGGVLAGGMLPGLMGAEVGFSLIGGTVGAVAGLMGGQAIDMLMPSGGDRQQPPVDGRRADATQPQHGRGHGHQVTPPQMPHGQQQVVHNRGNPQPRR